MSEFTVVDDRIVSAHEAWLKMIGAEVTVTCGPRAFGITGTLRSGMKLIGHLSAPYNEEHIAGLNSFGTGEVTHHDLHKLFKGEEFPNQLVVESAIKGSGGGIDTRMAIMRTEWMLSRDHLARRYMPSEPTSDFAHQVGSLVSDAANYSLKIYRTVERDEILCFTMLVRFSKERRHLESVVVRTQVIGSDGKLPLDVYLSRIRFAPTIADAARILADGLKTLAENND